MRKDYFWNTIGVLAQNAISPLLLIGITRINGIYDSGLFSYAFSVAIIFWAFGMWGGRTYQASDVKGEFAHLSYIVVRVLLAIIMLIGALIFSLVNGYGLTKSGVIVSLVLFKVIESIADAIHGILQVHGQLYNVGRSLLYKASLSLISFLLLDLLTKNIILGCLSIVIINVLFVLFYDIRLAKKLESLSFKSQQIKTLIAEAFTIMKRCAPVFAVAFLAAFSLNIPRYFIDRYDEAQIGYFGIMAMPITLITLLMTFMLQPKVVGLSKMYIDKEFKAFNEIVRSLVGITAIAGLGILVLTWLTGVQALHIVFGINFMPYKAALVVMVIGGIASALVSVCINILTIMRYFKAQFYILFISNAILAVISEPIIHSKGLIAGIDLFALTNIIQILLLITVYITIYRRQYHGKNT